MVTWTWTGMESRVLAGWTSTLSTGFQDFATDAAVLWLISRMLLSTLSHDRGWLRGEWLVNELRMQYDVFCKLGWKSWWVENGLVQAVKEDGIWMKILECSTNNATSGWIIFLRMVTASEEEKLQPFIHFPRLGMANLPTRQPEGWCVVWS